MATESVAIHSNPCRDPDHKVRADALFLLANGAYLDMWQIKAVAQMLHDHYEVQKADFPEDVSGGISAILTLASHASDSIMAKL